MKRRRIVRRVVLPTLWLVIGLAVAASLVKLAFLGGTVSATDDALAPTGEAPSETVPVELGAVSNTLTVDGTIELDPASPIVAPADGEFNWSWVRTGDVVAEGDRLFQIRSETMPEPTFEESESVGSEGGAAVEGTGEPVSPPDPPDPQPVVRYQDVATPTAGEVRLAVAPGDQVSKGTTMGTVQPFTFKAVGTISPLDRYRLLDNPSEARITINGGPAPFTCAELTIGQSASETAPSSPAEEGMGEEMGGEVGAMGSDAASRITCKVPSKVTVFDGLSMSMEIAAGSAKDVLVVPVTAVRGLLGTGTVWVVDQSGTPTERKVELGVTDGKVIEVRSGVNAGELVLRYVPGSEPDPTAELQGEYYG